MGIISLWVVFGQVGRDGGNLQAAAAGALEIFEFLPGAIHHFTGREDRVVLGVAANAAFMHGLVPSWLFEQAAQQVDQAA